VAHPTTNTIAMIPFCFMRGIVDATAATGSVQDVTQRNHGGHQYTERDHRRESLAAGRVQSDAGPTALKFSS
jgi:hypothetical protein